MKRFFAQILIFTLAFCYTSCSEDSPSEENDVKVSSISIIGETITDGGSSQLSVQVLPTNATNKSVNWWVSNTAVATISNTGLLTAVSNGSVVVQAIAKDGSGAYGERSFSISGVGSIPDNIVQTSQEILQAIANASAGDIIYIQGGEYEFSSTIQISGSGTNGNPIILMADPEATERPKFNFSSMTENSNNRGVYLSGDYWHIKGIDIFGAGDNGMYITGDNNLIEFCTFSENADSGLQISSGGSNNTILNCDSYYNADSTLENADGFACKLTAGSNNKFIGCRAWQNLDDGWDGYLRDNDDITTYYENCWAFNNGYLMDGTPGAGDGNGFKTGGSDDKTLKHHGVYKNCIAAGNIYDGFDHNSNRGNVELYNCSAYNNGRNINFSSTNIANFLLIKNTLSFSGVNSDSYSATQTDISHNGWQSGLVTDASDFVSVDINLLASPRNADGSLPDIDFLKLVSTSDLIDQGADVGLPFSGTAPDIGAFEFQD
ncbi:Ig-like domain-containing protein [Mangrovimonas sp. AS39]|uniref:right-handed parallel beta-helix repeat-containing protein n=1 Tax=Mangrovimonas futianensis TaxID=2895523 RepID=UPI001E4C034B|nr:Ig-like domain-containing protein [Mangrovimonas futianensis]MCF1190998.1 Ig-like domain-containing protein [Mangrovimonas futianensis]MCF1194693.1 Ig-like domain-containing protein [Mangrovimonas futianensis]